MNISSKVNNKNARPSRLLWIDLEMTGLDTDRHRIVEVAAIVTDFDFREYAQLETVVDQPEEVLELSDPVAFKMHTDNGLYEKVRASQISEAQAEAALRKLIEDNIPLDSVFLAGNSIRADWTFLHAQWPRIAEILHYRMLDVSSFKLWWLGKGKPEYKKQESHRALDDIRESIAELQHYLKSLNID